MARVKGAMMTRKRRKKVLKLAKGYWGSKSKHFKMAKQAVMKSGNYAYVGRKQRKRDFRRLWITRISAACKANGTNYSTFMNGLKKAGVVLNRKMLSEIAIADPAAFTALIEKAKNALSHAFMMKDYNPEDLYFDAILDYSCYLSDEDTLLLKYYEIFEPDKFWDRIDNNGELIITIVDDDFTINLMKEYKEGKIINDSDVKELLIEYNE